MARGTRTSRDVLPRLPFDDGDDVRALHPECSRQGVFRFALLAASANFANLIRREFAAALSFATNPATLGGHVGQVLGLGAEEQMHRVDAFGSVVAVMADEQAGGDRANKHFVGDPRDGSPPALSPPNADNAACRPFPKDASGWRLSADAVKESVRKRPTPCPVAARSRAELSLASVDVPGRGVEEAAAGLARAAVFDDRHAGGPLIRTRCGMVCGFSSTHHPLFYGG
jgi:hypothetical protein